MSLRPSNSQDGTGWAWHWGASPGCGTHSLKLMETSGGRQVGLGDPLTPAVCQLGQNPGMPRWLLGPWVSNGYLAAAGEGLGCL